jgi:hypothetical protein
MLCCGVLCCLPYRPLQLLVGSSDGMVNICSFSSSSSSSSAGDHANSKAGSSSSS